MTPHEALTNALMMLTQEAPLRRAKIADHDDQQAHRNEVIDGLSDLILMFEPNDGDNAREAQKRVPHPCRCRNCDLSFTRFFLPADAGRVALMAQRGAFCPRCYATEGIAVSWNSEDNVLPMSFSATIDSATATEATFGTQRRTLSIKLSASGKTDDIENALKALNSGKLATLTTMPNSTKP